MRLIKKMDRFMHAKAANVNLSSKLREMTVHISVGQSTRSVNPASFVKLAKDLRMKRKAPATTLT